MVKVEIIIETTSDKQLKLSIDQLRREDATAQELTLAVNVEAFVLVRIERAAKKAKLKFEKHTIEPTQSGQQG